MFNTWTGFCLFLLLQAQQPTFKSGVDVIAVDVHVVDRHGSPVLDLKPADFEVRIAGDRRPVVSVELITYGAPSDGTSELAVKPGGTPDAAPRPRRMFVLAVDEHSLHAANALAAVRAAERFIDGLQPDDLVGLYAYPTGVAKHDLTTDHASVRRALQTITGLASDFGGRFNLAPSEAIDIANGDREALRKTTDRVCGGKSSMGCMPRDVETDAVAQVGYMEMQVSQSVGALRGLARGLADIPGRKLLVLVSGGLISTDQAGGRADATAETTYLGREAALANVSVFALHLDWSFIQSHVSRGGVRTSVFRDGNLAATGLERVAGTAGGTVMRVYGTSPDAAFDRVLSETSAYYLLGVESREKDRDGHPKTIRVSVQRRGAQVRSRTQLVVRSK